MAIFEKMYGDGEAGSSGDDDDDNDERDHEPATDELTDAAKLIGANGVNPLTKSIVLKAWRRSQLCHHPDKRAKKGSPDDQSDDMCKRLNNAKDLLIQMLETCNGVLYVNHAAYAAESKSYARQTRRTRSNGDVDREHAIRTACHAAAQRERDATARIRRARNAFNKNP